MNNVLKLKQFLKKEKFVFIQPHNFPDPDAIASAYGLQYVLKQFNIKSKIIYSGFMTNRSVIDMSEKLKIKITHISKVNISSKSKIIVVDTMIGKSNIRMVQGDYIGFIDHHEGEQVNKNFKGYIDWRPEIGACSTIIGEYILDLNIKNIPRNISTALLIGIYIDTLRFARKTTPLDIKIVDKLYSFADIRFLNYVSLNIIELDDLKRISDSIKNLKVLKDCGIVKVKKIKSPQLLPILCDFFMQLRELNLIIGYFPKKRSISISVRNEKKEYNAQKLINEIIDNIGTGGGHSTMAAGSIDLGLVRENFNFERHLISILKNHLEK